MSFLVDMSSNFPLLYQNLSLQVAGVFPRQTKRYQFMIDCFRLQWNVFSLDVLRKKNIYVLEENSSSFRSLT